jgi:hypothetical protein
VKLITKTVSLLFVGGILVNPGQADPARPVTPANSPYATIMSGAPTHPAAGGPGVTQTLQLLPAATPAPCLPGLGREVQPVANTVPQPSVPRAVAVPGTPRAAQVVNHKRLLFNFDIKDVGFSGVSGIELWYTRDGWTWRKIEQKIHEGTCAVQVEEEGTYGFIFLPRTGFGGGKEPPQAGDPAQVWVEVDLSAPVVSLVRYQPEFVSRTLQIEWTATDKNLGQKPISLYYAPQSSGPWMPVAVNLENTGRYSWQMTPAMPASFWLRVEAVDAAGNAGKADSPSPVRIDLSQPSVTNIRVSTLGQ